MKKLGICRPALDEALSFISQRLYPHPLPLIDSSPAGDGCTYQADVIITCGTAGDYVLEFPGADAFELRISTAFTLALREETAALSNREQEWIRSHVSQANMFLAALQQRWITLRRIAEYLVAYQQAFLAEGPQHLRSLTRRDVAEALGLHESTVGRAVSDKVVQLPDGRLRPLAIFFDSALPAREAIRNLLDQSNSALSDQEIAEQLQALGWQLARRTVAKYRQQMSLPSSHHRNGH
jgi:RNA polymerase sigma-54 factor